MVYRCTVGFTVGFVKPFSMYCHCTSPYTVHSMYATVQIKKRSKWLCYAECTPVHQNKEFYSLYTVRFSARWERGSAEGAQHPFAAKTFDTNEVREKCQK